MTIDCKGKPCPQPVVLAMKAMKELAAGDTLDVIVDNAAAVENLNRLAGKSGCDCDMKDQKDGTFVVSIHMPENACQVMTDITTENIVVAVGTDEMGQGDPKLGHALAKAFIYALAQMEELPKTILFFNGGARLTVEGSEALADIQGLAERGVDIMTCGTCLDFYGIKDQLKVGGVTNMYSIVETMMKADKVIRI